ncbi:MAG: type II toxin-antitoxin system HicB family antitoxin [Hyphomicrobium sp.]
MGIVIKRKGRLRFFGLIHQQHGRATGVSFPDLPGCFAAADDAQDIECAAKEAVGLYLEASDVAVQPRSLDQLLEDAEFAEAVRSGAAVMAVVIDRENEG